MPRRKEPKRVIEISVGTEEVQEAMKLWFERYHQINVDVKSIEFDFDPESKELRGVKAEKQPHEVKPQPE